MKRLFILAVAAFALSGCVAVAHDDGHTVYTPPPWFFHEHHVTHDHGHHNVNHHFTNKYGWTSHRPYYNPCNC